MSLSGIIEMPRLQAKREFVMPAKAGIQVNVLNLKINKPGFPPARE
jgi:hypothetical protein